MVASILSAVAQLVATHVFTVTVVPDELKLTYPTSKLPLDLTAFFVTSKGFLSVIVLTAPVTAFAAP